MAFSFQKISDFAAKWTGSKLAFIFAVAFVLGWAIAGPFYHFSDSWSLFINTGTTIITFIMVFLIQSTQNRADAALHVKLDELIRVGEARNELIGLEHKTEEEIKQAVQVTSDICEKDG